MTSNVAHLERLDTLQVLSEHLLAQPDDVLTAPSASATTTTRPSVNVLPTPAGTADTSSSTSASSCAPLGQVAGRVGEHDATKAPAAAAGADSAAAAESAPAAATTDGAGTTTNGAAASASGKMDTGDGAMAAAAFLKLTAPGMPFAGFLGSRTFRATASGSNAPGATTPAQRDVVAAASPDGTAAAASSGRTALFTNQSAAQQPFSGEASCAPRPVAFGQGAHAANTALTAAAHSTPHPEMGGAAEREVGEILQQQARPTDASGVGKDMEGVTPSRMNSRGTISKFSAEAAWPAPLVTPKVQALARKLLGYKVRTSSEFSAMKQPLIQSMAVITNV